MDSTDRVKTVRDDLPRSLPRKDMLPIPAARLDREQNLLSALSPLEAGPRDSGRSSLEEAEKEKRELYAVAREF